MILLDENNVVIDNEVLIQNEKITKTKKGVLGNYTSKNSKVLDLKIPLNFLPFISGTIKYENGVFTRI